MPLYNKASNAVMAKARALYGRRLTDEDYERLAECRTMPELAGVLKNLPLYQPALRGVNPVFARRAQLEYALRSSIFSRYDTLCRYDMSAGDDVYRYFLLCCEVDEITACLRCLDAGRPGDYLYRLPDFLQQRCGIDLYKLAHATDAQSLLKALRGTPYAAMLAPLRHPAPGSLQLRAEPVLEDYRHRALVALAKGKAGGTAAMPTVRDYIAMECDTSALSNAARLIRMHAPAAKIDASARRDCTALSNAEWQQLLAAPDIAAFKELLGETCYGAHLQNYVYPVLKEGLRHYQYDWCQKWLRFSTDPTLVMLCYVFLARMEVENLNHIIEGVHYQLGSGQILPLLVGYTQPA